MKTLHRINNRIAKVKPVVKLHAPDVVALLSAQLETLKLAIASSNTVARDAELIKIQESVTKL